MVEVKTVDFSEMIPDMEKVMRKELGFKGIVKIAFKLLLRPNCEKQWMNTEKSSMITEIT